MIDNYRWVGRKSVGKSTESTLIKAAIWSIIFATKQYVHKSQPKFKWTGFTEWGVHRAIILPKKTLVMSYISLSLWIYDTQIVYKKYMYQKSYIQIKRMHEPIGLWQK